MGIGYRWQEKASGGLPAVVSRELGRIAGGASVPASHPAIDLQPGARLVRSWQGRTIEVLVLEQGFRFEERTYASLTAIANAVTGGRWSGPRFFGLTAHA